MNSTVKLEFDNRRKFHRINFEGQVNLKFVDNKYECCQVKNLSLTGMFVKGKFLKQQEENCLLRIFHNESSGDNSMRASGEVVWKNSEGVGLRFTSMTFENYMLLQSTLINKAKQPVIVLSEFPRDCPFEITTV